MAYSDCLEEKSLAKGLLMANGYLKVHKFEGEKFGNLPMNCQICQCFLLPMFSAIEYMSSEL